MTDGAFRYAMDNGAEVAVAVNVDRAARHVTIDFTGSSATLPDNFNAPTPVVRAAVLYVLRTMLDDPIPMNEGCLAPVTLIVPQDSMLSARAIPPRSSRAMSRRARSSPTRCSPLSARWRPRRAR